MKLNKKRISMIAVVITVIFLSGCMSSNQEKAEQQNLAVARAEVLEVNVHEDITDEVKKCAEEMIGDDKDRVGFIFYDLLNDRSVMINEYKYFTAASTYKVGMNVVVYEMVKKEMLSLNNTIRYNSSYFEGGTGNLQNEDKSQPIKIQKLLDYSIMYSDNIATNMIGRNIGGHADVRQKLYEMFDFTDTEDIKSNLITPKLELEILKKIYNSREEGNYAHLIDVMKNTVFHDMLDKYIPYDECAHKIGNYGGYVNDVGIVFNETPYIIIVYTNNIENAEERIAVLSQSIYNLQKDNM